jgi:hypothetical protein
MKENIEIGQTREFGDIISDTFIFLRQNFLPLLNAYFVICGAFLVVGILASLMFDSDQSQTTFADLFSFNGIFGLLFSAANYTSLVVTALSYMALYREKGNQPPDVKEVWSYVKYFYFRVLWSQILLAIVLGVATMLCFFPGVYLFPIFSLVVPIMIMENTNLEYAAKKAFKIIKENWWFAFGTMLLMCTMVVIAILVFMIPALLISSGGQWLTGKNLNTSYVLVQSIVSYLTEALWLIPVISVTLLYYTLIEAREATSLTSRIKMFGTSNTQSDDIKSEEY